MKRFSERYGYKQVREQIQYESMDESLRNHLWTALTIFYWNTFSFNTLTHRRLQDRIDTQDNKYLHELSQKLWVYYYGQPIDEIPLNWDRFLPFLKNYVVEAEWFEVYDLIELISELYSIQSTNEEFREYCNNILEVEKSAYRFVNDKITPIVNSEEIEAIEKAIDKESGPVKEHLNSALEKLSDRKKPDYRNSIKESISAVECLVREVVGEKGTLGDLLKIVDKHVQIHPALRDSFKKLYGYTSDEDGIRHSLMEDSKADFEDAKFMLVTCSAFVNYVRGKLK